MVDTQDIDQEGLIIGRRRDDAEFLRGHIEQLEERNAQLQAEVATLRNVMDANEGGVALRVCDPRTKTYGNWLISLPFSNLARNNMLGTDEFIEIVANAIKGKEGETEPLQRIISLNNRLLRISKYPLYNPFSEVFDEVLRAEDITELALGHSILEALPDPILILDSHLNLRRFYSRTLNSSGEDLNINIFEQYPEALPQFTVQVALTKSTGTPQTDVYSLSSGKFFSITTALISEHEDSQIVVHAHEITSEMQSLVRQENAKIALLAFGHDLASPTNSILAYLYLLETKYGDNLPEEAKDFLNTLKVSGEQIKRILSQIRQTAEIETHLLSPNFEILDIQRAVTDLWSTFPQRDRIVLDWATQIEPVTSDLGILDRILTNLIKNAVKYSPDDSNITVQCRQEGETLVISVEDKGQGIPAGNLPYIFDPFRRADNATSYSDVEGTGLGLSVVKKMVNGLGGTISVDSIIEKGTTFTVKLPLRPLSES